VTNLLKMKEVPFLLSLLFSIAGAVILSVGNNIKELPVLEYSHHVAPDRIVIQITNISTVRFDRITLLIECDTAHAIDKLHNPVYIPPAMQASSNKLPFQSAPNEWEYQLGPLQPHNTVRVVCSVKQGVDFSLRFMISDQIALVTTPNLTTFIIKNETTLLVVLLLVLIAAIIAFYIAAYKNRKQDKEGP